MSKREKKGLVPKLRFPEFQDAGVWKRELFEKIYSFKTTNSLPRDKLNYEKGAVKNIHYGDIHTKFSTLFYIEKEVVPYISPSESLERIKPESFCVEGDMIFADKRKTEKHDSDNEKKLHTIIKKVTDERDFLARVLNINRKILYFFCKSLIDTGSVNSKYA